MADRAGAQSVDYEQQEAASRAGGESPAELKAEIAQQQKEILRLRDLLIGKDAELGAAKGRLAMYEDRSKRLAGAGQRLGTRLPGFGLLKGILVRLLRGRS
ncbi:MAG: hypothetical protein ACTHNP_05860 [Solirubrobacterales bacterium]